VLPGRGYIGVTIEPPADKLYERGQGVSPDRMDETIRTEPNTIAGHSLHSLTRLDVPADATQVNLDFQITPGRSAKLAIRGPVGPSAARRAPTPGAPGSRPTPRARDPRGPGRREPSGFPPASSSRPSAPEASLPADSSSLGPRRDR